MVVILALAAGLSYIMGDGFSLKNQLIIWGCALLWIVVFSTGHVKEMRRLVNNENKVIERLKKGEKFRYTEKAEPALSRWLTAIVSALIGMALLYFSVNTLCGAKLIGESSIELTAEITVIIFAAILAVLAALMRIFPLRQRYYGIRVSVLENDPTMLKYRVRRLS
jgi:hypothetical protein